MLFLGDGDTGECVRGEGYTLSSDTSVSENPDFPADLVMDGVHEVDVFRPVVFLLVFVGVDEASRGDEPVHDGPFGNWGAVDARAGGERDGGFFDDGVGEEVVETGGEGVDDFDSRFK